MMAQVFSFSMPETWATSPLAVNILGHVDIRVTQNAPHNLLPCAFAQHMAGMRGAEASKIPFIGRLRISAKAVC